MRRFPLLALALAAPVFAADTAAEAPAPLNEAQATPVTAPAAEAGKSASETAPDAKPGILAATPATLPPAAAKALAKDGLVGAWTCGTSYPALSARLDEHYEFRADGSAESDGMMTFFLKAGLLHYDVHSSDHWTLADNILAITIADRTVLRAFKPRMAEILAKSPELTAYEEKLFARLNHSDKDNRVRLTVTAHDAQTLHLRDDSGNVSECQRAK